MRKLVACAVAKNEGRYLSDWIRWHQKIGVEHFFIYDACCDDLTFKELEPYVWSGAVTFIPTTFHPCQNQAYWHCAQSNIGKAEWILFCDIDEFLCAEGIPDNDFRLFLEKLTHKNIGGIAFPWLCYGSNAADKYEPTPVWNRITKRVDYDAFKHSKHIKSIMRPQCISEVNDPHWIKTRAGFYTIDILGRPITISEHPHGYLPDDKIVFAHYVTKTREEWAWKFARGSADSGPEAYNARKMEDFDNHMKACTLDDYRMQRMARRLGL